jgi:hypothetical protein
MTGSETLLSNEIDFRESSLDAISTLTQVVLIVGRFRFIHNNVSFFDRRSFKPISRDMRPQPILIQSAES